MSTAAHRPNLASLVRLALVALSVAGLVASALATQAVRAAPQAGEPVSSASIDHLVVSEVMTGGASASDEFVELYNPTSGSLSLEGLELVYVTATGTTITRKASWSAGSAIPPAAHVLAANELGLFAGVADATYAGGLSATGGSMALRAIGGSTAIDAVGWGTAASSWLEGSAAPAPPAGQSLERLPGGSAGSGQDTDINVVDFFLRAVPDPQNAASPPIGGTPSPSPSSSPLPTDTATPSPTPSETATPSASPTPAPSATASPTATPSPTPSPPPTPPPPVSATPSPSEAPVLTIAAARALPDGSTARISGVALTDSTFTEGGGYVADASGGLAMLIDGAAVPRGVEVILAGTVGDRYAQRTLRVDAAGVAIIGSRSEPTPVVLDTGLVGEAVEAQLVRIEGVVAGAPTALAAGLAFEVDDGSGSIRVLVGPATGIDTGGWVPGASVGVIGIVGQRDSSGTGVGGYRVQPRDSADVGFVIPPPSPTPEPTASPSPSAMPTPSPSGSPSPALVTIAQARASEPGTRLRIRGVVTLPSGLVDPSSAVVNDPSGAILVRIGTDVGRLARGQLVELSGTRSTKSGMVSVRVTHAPLVLGAQAEPDPLRRSTASIGEEVEARLVIVRGLVADGPRRSTAGSISFTLNDGSGAARIYVASTLGLSAGDLTAGSWAEVRGVVGQETSGSSPHAGYRIWPRDRADIRVLAGASSAGTGKHSKPALEVRRRPGAHPAAGGPAVGGANPLLEMPPPVASASVAALASGTMPRQPAPDPIPVAAGFGSMAGLVVLAWRHGTWVRLGTVVVPLVASRVPAWPDGGIEGGESYTPPP